MTSPREAGAITDFFVDNFWDAPISKPKQRQQLSLEVYKDLTSRYVTSKAVRVLYIVHVGGTEGKTDPPPPPPPQQKNCGQYSIVQKPAGGKSALLVAKDGGRVVGCVGLETRVVRDGQITKMESLKGDIPGASLQPVIANLAVDRRCVKCSDWFEAALDSASVHPHV